MKNEDIKSFYQGIKKLDGKINKENEKVDKITKQFENEMKELLSNINRSKEDYLSKHKNNQGIKYISEVINKIQSAIVSWEDVLKQEIKRKKFKEGTKDKFVVIAYGKVKAGKSSLGNYIAKNNTLVDEPKFFKFDKAGNETQTTEFEELDENEFDVKTTECTNSIQGLHLAGMSWIDTPGLLSMTAQNGQLAKDYIDAADLVIYLMSSDSPGRKTDTNEIKELALNGKEFCVILTKSDLVEQDEIDGELVSIRDNKSEIDRKKQEEYVKEEIKSVFKELSDESGKNYSVQMLSEIMSISVLMAKENPTESKEFKKSNIPKFYKMLENVLSENWKRIESEQSLKNMQAHMNKYITENNEFSLAKTIKKCVELKNKIKKINEELKERKKDIQIECIDEVDREIKYKISLKEKLSFSKNDFSDLINNKIEPIIKKEAVKKLKEISDQMSIEFPVYNIDDKKLKLKEKTKIVELDDEIYCKATGKAIGGATGGVLAAYAIANFWNPTGWIAGIGAFAVGCGTSYIAGEIGKGIGNEFKSKYKKKIKFGKDSEGLEKIMSEESEKAIKNAIDVVIENFEKLIIFPLEETLNSIEKNVRDTQKKLIKEILS
ncbi:hypothetical protein C0585_01795 [Candidatus Woesearchaeota archaeon]|nr:MAG: hypothetical protein C0585_01795 [Candidatus Woesearchaeota archaeon]